MRFIATVSAAVLLVGCAAKSTSTLNPKASTFEAHTEPVCLVPQLIEKRLIAETLGPISGKKNFYGSRVEVFKAMANEARRVGAHAIIGLEGRHEVSMWAWARPAGRRDGGAACGSGQLRLCDSRGKAVLMNPDELRRLDHLEAELAAIREDSRLYRQHLHETSLEGFKSTIALAQPAVRAAGAINGAAAAALLALLAHLVTDNGSRELVQAIADCLRWFLGGGCPGGSHLRTRVRRAMGVQPTRFFKWCPNNDRTSRRSSDRRYRRGRGVRSRRLACGCGIPSVGYPLKPN